MYQMLFYLSLSLYFSLVNSESPSNTGKPNFVYSRLKYDILNTVIVNSTTEQILDFDEDSAEGRTFPTRVHVSSNDTLDGEYPVLITATQQKGVTSWELPLEVETADQVTHYQNMARTLCPHDAGPNITSVNRPRIQISTARPNNVSVVIKLRRFHDFYVLYNNTVALNVTPGAPKYYYFSFDSHLRNNTVHGFTSPLKNTFLHGYTIPKSVILTIDSEDSLCAVISIQNNSCPVFDNEREILYRGYRFTMTTKGGITLTQSMYPHGFYVVFLVRQSDAACTGVSETKDPSLPTRLKKFRFKVEATITLLQYVIGASVLLALILAFALLAISFTYCATLRKDEVVLVQDMVSPTISLEPAAGTSETEPIVLEESSDSDLASATTSVTVTRLVTPMTIASLTSSQSAKEPRYFGSSLTVAVVYALPVVQLLVTYQRMVVETGDQDVCYYNFLCAHPLLQMSDFNHVYSNIAYVVLGIIFMVQVRAREKREKLRDKSRGIALNASLLYSMGLTLCMEGLLSACYHLCPNKMNFQFDSSFMYGLCVLGIVRLYAARHAVAAPRAHQAFLVLAALMATGVYGIMYPSIYFWVIFTLLHLATCFVLTLKIYYVGKKKLDRKIFVSAYRSLHSQRHFALIPDYRARAALLAIANLVNWVIAGYGAATRGDDVARHLLAILLANTALHLVFYLLMKLVHREKLALYTWMYLVLALAAWGAAVAFFTDSKTKWSQPPSESRGHNLPCVWLQMYDSHDLWHAASAAALYLTLNALLTLDDPLAHTHIAHIPVF